MNRPILLLPAILCPLFLSACTSDDTTRSTTVRTETTTTTVESTADPAPVAPRSNTGSCYALLHEMPLIQAAPQKHFALIPSSRDILPDDVLIGTLPPGTRIRLIQTREYQGQGGAAARFTFGRIETGIHAGKTVATDRVGLSYTGTITADHVQAVPCP